MSSAESGQLTTLGNGQARLSLMDRIAAQLSERGWNSDEVYGVQMAIEEAVSNAFRHGNQNGEKGDVDIRWESSISEFWMQVTDQGEGFDESNVPDPTAPENLEKGCGRGLLLMRHYMEDVRFDNGGRTVVMRKRRSK